MGALLVICPQFTPYRWVKLKDSTTQYYVAMQILGLRLRKVSLYIQRKFYLG